MTALSHTRELKTRTRPNSISGQERKKVDESTNVPDPSQLSGRGGSGQLPK